jgi:hypothetical protein
VAPKDTEKHSKFTFSSLESSLVLQKAEVCGVWNWERLLTRLGGEERWTSLLWSFFSQLQRAVALRFHRLALRCFGHCFA